MGASLTAKGLTGTTIGASDENSLDEAYNIMRTSTPRRSPTMSQMNGHSYSAGASARPNLRTLATSKSKRLWQSESGPLNVTLANNTEAAMFMAGRIITDLRDMQPEAWLDWQIGDPSDSWASIRLSDGQQTWTPLKRFYMHAGFSRFIRPGATMLAVTPADMVAFSAGDGATLVVVIRNGDAPAPPRRASPSISPRPGRRRAGRRLPHVADGEPGVARGDPGAGLELHGQRARLLADHAGDSASLSGYFFFAAAGLGLSAGFR